MGKLSCADENIYKTHTMVSKVIAKHIQQNYSRFCGRKQPEWPEWNLDAYNEDLMMIVSDKYSDQ